MESWPALLVIRGMQRKPQLHTTRELKVTATK